MKDRLRSSVAVSIAVSTLICVIVPLQSYWGNRTLFDFSLGRLLMELVVVWGAATICCGLFLFAAWRFVGMWFHAVVLAVGVCAYFESGVLSIGLPPLDGDVWLFTDVIRKIYDAGIILVLLVLTILLSRLKRNFIFYSSLALLLLSGASFFDVKEDESLIKENEFSSGFNIKYDILNAATLSSSRNVIIFILDAMPATITSELLEEESGLRDRFDGFYVYKNNIGMHDVTRRGIPGLLTGKYLEKGVSASEYASSIYSEDSFLMPYKNLGCPIYFSVGIGDYGFSNQNIPKSCHIDNINNTWKGACLSRRSKEIPFLTLFEIVRFRLTPYRWKAEYLLSCHRRGNNTPNIESESLLFTTLANAKIQDVDGTNLLVFHSRGVHPPISTDRYGNKTSLNDTPIGIREKSHYIFSLMADMFDVWRQRGVYDKTMIIVTTDHGNPILRTDEMMGQYSAILWIKPIESKGAVRFFNIPTSHVGISRVVTESVTRNLTEMEIERILVTHNRKFRGKPSRLSSFYDWFFDDKGNCVGKKDLGIFSEN